MSNDARLEATIHGIVQGVFYRYTTRVEAMRLGLVGTVRNRPDGTVAVVAEGPRETLESLLSWLAHGPDHATVESVDAAWSEPTGGFTAFRIV